MKNELILLYEYKKKRSWVRIQVGVRNFSYNFSTFQSLTIKYTGFNFKNFNLSCILKEKPASLTQELRQNFLYFSILEPSEMGLHGHSKWKTAKIVSKLFSLHPSSGWQTMKLIFFAQPIRRTTSGAAEHDFQENLANSTNSSSTFTRSWTYFHGSVLMNSN